MKTLGRWNMVNTLDGLHGFSARLLTQVLGMTPAELEELLTACHKEITNPKIQATGRCMWICLAGLMLAWQRCGLRPEAESCVTNQPSKRKRLISAVLHPADNTSSDQPAKCTGQHIGSVKNGNPRQLRPLVPA